MFNIISLTFNVIFFNDVLSFLCKKFFKMRIDKNEKHLRFMHLWWTKFLIGVFMFLNISNLISQKNGKLPYRFGGGIGTHVSGNAHGGIYDVYGSLYDGKSLFSVGPCIQKRSNTICGARMSFSYLVTGMDDFLPDNKFAEREKLQLYFFSYLQYIYKAPLSFNSVKREEILSQRNDRREIDFNKYKLSTVEAGLGFGLNIKLNKQLVLGNYIGLSMYYHANYVNGMYADQIAPTLILGTSLGLNFF